MTKPKVLVLSGYGINCEEETSYAFELAGAQPAIVHVNDLIIGKFDLLDYQILVIPGGFSYGDDTGSGNAMASKIRNHLWPQLLEFISKDTLTLGICNGFQVLANLGLLPVSGDYGSREVALIHNDSANYLNRWVDLKVADNDSPWLKGIDSLSLPIAHGEGKFFADDPTLELLEQNKQVAFTYTQGEVIDFNGLPVNPNGSLNDIAGITDKSGKILGLMPHPERAIFTHQLPNWTLKREQAGRENEELDYTGPGMVLFENGVKYFQGLKEEEQVQESISFWQKYQSPFSWRYGSEQMQTIFSEENKYKIWRRIWVALASVQNEAGLVSDQELADLIQLQDNVDIERILEIESETRHDVVAAIREFAEKAKVGGGKIHFGATSMDVVDNSDSIRILQAAEIVEQRLLELLKAFAEKIDEYADLTCMGYTHLQPAEPTTVGYRFAFYAQNLLVDLSALQAAVTEYRAKGIKGAVGTAASYSSILKGSGMSVQELEEKVCQKLGLNPAVVTNQTISRKYEVRVLDALQGIGASCAKFAADLRILQSAGIGEMQEPFRKKQVGSSAMPFKKNPVSCEKLDSLERLLSTKSLVGSRNLVHSYLDRTLDDSANRRVVIPESFLIVDEILSTATKILSDIQVHKDRIKHNLERFAPFAATENVIIEAVKKGADRQQMHEVIRELSMSAWEQIQRGQDNPLPVSLKSNQTIAEFLSSEQVEELLQVDAHVGDAPDRAKHISYQIRTMLNSTTSSNKSVAIVMGSDSDLPVVQKAMDVLDSFGIGYTAQIMSAHRSPEATAEFAKQAKEQGVKVIIAAAGGAAHLPGVIAAFTTLPVIGLPIKSASLSGVDSLYSIVQMPSGVPVATVSIDGAKNSGILAVQILGASNPAISKQLEEYKITLAKETEQKGERLKEAMSPQPLQLDDVEAVHEYIETVDVPGLGKKEQGKVRDIYVKDGRRILITTDRQSAFDRVLGTIPHKGAVLNQLAAFWFAETEHIVPNHLIAVPDQNVTIAKELEPIPVEVIVRGYMTGVTTTSIWYSYSRGEREIYGIEFPDGLRKNEKLPTPVITPTTHGGGPTGHDERLTRDEIIEQGIVEEGLYEEIERVALELFDYGSKLCERNGIILVDTKYEFGLYKGKLTLMDEIHTPDSSRLWIADTYQERFDRGDEPENFDKEFLRLWFSERGYKGDGEPPAMTAQLISDLSERYIQVYEKITGRSFQKFDYPIEQRIIENIKDYFRM